MGAVLGLGLACDPGDAYGEPCSQERASVRCALEDDEPGHQTGVQFCYSVEGQTVWGECVRTFECEPTSAYRCEEGGLSCEFDEDGRPVARQCAPEATGDCFEANTCTPLVLAFSDAPVSFAAARADAAFDLSARGHCAAHDWPTEASPWLARDLDGDGAIEDGRELFGSGTVLADGRNADNGFAALAELDADGDGMVTETDPGFAELVVWSDHDGDQRSSPSELEPLSAFGVSALPLSFGVRRDCDARGNCSIEQADLVFEAGGVTRRGRLVDVHLRCR